MENEVQSNIPPVQPLTQNSSPVKPSANWLKILLFILLGLIVIAGSVFAGIQIGKNQAPTQQPITVKPTALPTQIAASPTTFPTTTILSTTPTTSPISVTPTVNPTANWKTYTNNTFGYSLKIPINWTNYSMNDFSAQPFTNLEEQLYLGQKNSTTKPPQIMQISSYKSSTYQEQAVLPSASCTVKTVLVGVDQINAKYKICKGMESLGSITVKTSQFVFIIDELKGSVTDHQIFNQILSTFKFTN